MPRHAKPCFLLHSTESPSTRPVVTLVTLREGGLSVCPLSSGMLTLEESGLFIATENVRLKRLLYL